MLVRARLGRPQQLVRQMLQHYLRVAAQGLVNLAENMLASNWRRKPAACVILCFFYMHAGVLTLQIDTR